MSSIKISSTSHTGYGIYREGNMSSCYRSYKRVKIIQTPRIHLWALKQMAKEKQGRGEIGAWKKEQAYHGG